MILVVKVFFHRIWNRYGIIDLGFLSPLLFGPPIGAAIGSVLGANRRRLQLCRSIGIIVWNIAPTLIAATGLSWLKSCFLRNGKKQQSVTYVGLKVMREYLLRTKRAGDSVVIELPKELLRAEQVCADMNVKITVQKCQRPSAEKAKTECSLGPEDPWKLLE